jgi:hypothetical protein
MSKIKMKIKMRKRIKSKRKGPVRNLVSGSEGGYIP